MHCVVSSDMGSVGQVCCLVLEGKIRALVPTEGWPGVFQVTGREIPGDIRQMQPPDEHPPFLHEEEEVKWEGGKDVLEEK